ncbi:MAG: cytochrome c oxidase subunit 3 [Rhizobiales bacterium]|nr:cytochrome c oxidase subunit 3 [Hyphomicrobiales bacterium]
MPEPGDIAAHLSSPKQRDEVLELGMWTFLSTEVLLFGGLILTYMVYRHADSQSFAEASRQTRIVIGTINTATLLTSSFCVAAAIQAGQAGAAKAVRGLLGVAIVLGLIFLGLKSVEYLGEYRDHLVPGIDFEQSGPHVQGIRLFFTFYFVATGLHAVHLLCGIAVLAIFLRCASRVARNARYLAGLRTAGLYWHFVDVVWIFLYALIYLPGRSG